MKSTSQASVDYSRLVEQIEGPAMSNSLVFTIPRGFMSKDEEDRLRQKQQLSQQFQKLVLEVEIASRDKRLD